MSLVDQPDSDPDLDIDLIAASLRADASDLSAYVEALAVKLEEMLPGGVQVQRVRAGLFGPKRVARIAVDGNEHRLELRVDGDAMRTTRARLSGGIVLKTESVEPDAWLQQLSQTLAAQANRSAATRQALERLLNG